jgi:prepilin-type N-terminal cleavage/methylation domain-containing protein
VGTKKQQNKGFTLVELIIAIAMLAFLLTAVSSFMTSGIISYKKSKADIRVHNSAQENYDKIADAIMEAKDIYIFGYKQDDTSTPRKLYCFVRDADQAALAGNLDLETNFGVAGLGTFTTELFSDCDVTKSIYIKAIVVDTAVPVDASVIGNLESTGTATVTENGLTGDTTPVVITVAKRTVTKCDASGNPVIGSDGNYETESVDSENAQGDKVYNVSDTERQLFVFNGSNMYYMTKYAFAKANDDNNSAGSEVPDVLSGKDDNERKVKSALNDFVYSISFEKLDDGTTNCVANVDAANNSLSVDLYYSDKNMTYTTQGMIKTRNSFVLKARKDTETSEEEVTE